MKRIQGVKNSLDILHKVEYNIIMRFKIPFLKVFRPEKKGIHRVLGELEGDVMEILWSRKKKLTGREIWQKLKKKKTAYTTVLTVLDRLVNKKLIKKERSPANVYLYEPAISEEDFKRMVSEAVFKSLFEFSGGAITSFINFFESIDPTLLDELEQILKKKKAGLNGK
jgi:predicted transcriptional regulator